MKRNLCFALIVFFCLVLGVSMVGCATSGPASSSLADLVGIWEGSYMADQGETGMTLTIWEDNGNYKAIWHFFNLPGKTNAAEGSYYMRIFINYSTGKFNLVGHEWINRPGPAWGMMSLEGTVQGNVFTGNALVHGRSDDTFTFRVVRQ